MQSFHHSRARILFEVACAFGISASCVVAWMQTYATAMLPAAAIAALYGLVHAFDMVRGSQAASETVAVAEPATDHLDADETAFVAAEAPEFVESPVMAVAEPSPKRTRKSSKQKSSRARPEAEATEFVSEPQPEITTVTVQPEPEVAPVAEEVEPEAAAVAEETEFPELPPELRIVESASDEPTYVPATPLFEAEPFVRQQRAAFGRKAR